MGCKDSVLSLYLTRSTHQYEQTSNTWSQCSSDRRIAHRFKRD
jgi:hypothetical protein